MDRGSHSRPHIPELGSRGFDWILWVAPCSLVRRSHRQEWEYMLTLLAGLSLLEKGNAATKLRNFIDQCGYTWQKLSEKHSRTLDRRIHDSKLQC